MSKVSEHLDLFLTSPRTYLRYVRGVLQMEAVEESTSVRIEIAKQAAQRKLARAAANPQDASMAGDRIDQIAKVSVLSRWLSAIAWRLIPLAIFLFAFLSYPTLVTICVVIGLVIYTVGKGGNSGGDRRR